MLWTPKLSLSNIHVRLTAKGLLRNLQLLSGCRRTAVVFQTVEKSKAKASSRQQQQPQQRVPAKGPSAGGRVSAPAEAGGNEQSKRKDHVLQRLGELLAAGNRKFEAIAVVLQWTLAEFEVVTCDKPQGLNAL
ncbi:unnamed protein product [Boreogadus saida]